MMFYNVGQYYQVNVIKKLYGKSLYSIIYDFRVGYKDTEFVNADTKIQKRCHIFKYKIILCKSCCRLHSGTCLRPLFLGFIDIIKKDL